MAVLSTLRAVTGHVGEFADVCPRMSRRFSRPGGIPQLHYYYWTVTLYDYYHLTSPRFHAGLKRSFSADCSYDSFSVVRPVQVAFRPGDRPDLPSYPGVNHRSSEPGPYRYSGGRFAGNSVKTYLCRDLFATSGSSSVRRGYNYLSFFLLRHAYFRRMLKGPLVLNAITAPSRWYWRTPYHLT